MNKDILKVRKNKRGFTLAEVLITLVIIGVVTALTIPSLLSSVSEKTYAAKRQGFATRMAQAISQIGVLNAYEAEGSDQDKIDNSSMNFIVEGLQKAYSITAVCEFENFKQCDFPDSLRKIDGGTYNTLEYPTWEALNENATAVKLGGINTKAAAFRTKNGESALLYYNPRCIAEQIIEPDTVIDPSLGAGVKNFAKEICINIIYDLDGARKGPNSTGKDIGYITVLYPDTPYLLTTNGMVGQSGATGLPSYAENETNTSANSVTGACNRVTGSGYNAGYWTLASREEAYSTGINYKLAYNPSRSFLWTSTVEGANETDYGWMVNQFELSAKLASRKDRAVGTCIVKFE